MVNSGRNATSGMMSGLRVDLEQASAALAAADAHGHHAPFCLAANALLQKMPGEPRTRRTERVADGNRSTIHVVFCRVDTEPVAAVEALTREGLVQLPQIDVVDPQSLALEQPRNREHRPDTHLIGLAPGSRPRNESTQRPKTSPLGLCRFHANHRSCSIGQLAGVAGSNILSGAFDRCDLRERLEGGIS